MIDEVPKGWSRLDFFDFCVLQRGYDLPLSQAKAGPYPIVTSAGVVTHHAEFKARGPGVVTGRSGSIGRVFFVKSDYWPHNTALFVKDFCGNEPRFVYYFLRGFDISQYGASTAVPTLNRNNLRHVAVNVPPVAEQRRIVAKLEILLALVEGCQARLAIISSILKRFRLSVLAAACSGRLTADWRHQNSNGGADYSVTANGAEVPTTWVWTNLSTIAEVRGGVTKGRKLSASQKILLPYLRVANVQDGYLDLSEIKTIEALPSDKEKYALRPGDLLFTEGGDRDKLGRGTVWRGEIEDCIHQNHIFRARIISDALPEYVSIASKSDASRRYFFENASQTVNLASINLKTLSALPVPLPPLLEQVEIVRRVKDLLEIADHVAARFQLAQTQIEKLTPSLLAKAFRGELVVTEADLVAESSGCGFEPAMERSVRITVTPRPVSSNGAAPHRVKRSARPKQ